MSKLLINLPSDASTNKYPTMFPYPLILMKMMGVEDYLLDANLLSYKQNAESKLETVEKALREANSNLYEKVIVCCGEYAPDGYYSKYYDYFLDHVSVPIEVVGAYAETYSEHILSKYADKVTLPGTDYDVCRVKIPYEMLIEYPYVGNNPKANVRITYGCPRHCAMCPVVPIYKGKYRYGDINYTANLIAEYYAQGVRYINFIDDNISASTKKFVEFMQILDSMNLKGMKYHCQEGFEVSAFKDDEFCDLLKKLKFQDIKLGVENIKEDFLKKIGKYYTSFSDIEEALANIEKHKLNVRFFFLIAPFQSESDILDNIRYFASKKLDVRASVLRDYEGTSLAKYEEVTPRDVLARLKALSYTACYMSTKHDTNIFTESFLSYIEKKGYKLVDDRLVGGKQYFGFDTERWLAGLEYMSGWKFIYNESRKEVERFEWRK